MQSYRRASRLASGSLGAGWREPPGCEIAEGAHRGYVHGQHVDLSRLARLRLQPADSFHAAVPVTASLVTVRRREAIRELPHPESLLSPRWRASPRPRRLVPRQAT